MSNQRRRRHPNSDHYNHANHETKLNIISTNNVNANTKQNIFCQSFQGDYKYNIKETLELKLIHPYIKDKQLLHRMDEKLVLGYIHEQQKYAIYIPMDIICGVFNYFPKSIPKPNCHRSKRSKLTTISTCKKRIRQILEQQKKEEYELCKIYNAMNAKEAVLEIKTFVLKQQDPMLSIYNPYIHQSNCCVM
eukprot:318942_1